jgi:hypothetical protein
MAPLHLEIYALPGAVIYGAGFSARPVDVRDAHRLSAATAVWDVTSSPALSVYCACTVVCTG